MADLGIVDDMQQIMNQLMAVSVLCCFQQHLQVWEQCWVGGLIPEETILKSLEFVKIEKIFSPHCQ